MKNTVATFAQAKAEGRKLAMLTAYDYSTAKLEDEAGIDGILIGDSLGNVVLGYEDTLSVTVEDMIHHSAAVARGAKNALIVCDMPFLSYEVSVPDAVRNAGRLLKDSDNDIARNLGGAAEIAGAVGAVATAADVLAETSSNAEAMATAYGVTIPSAKKQIIALAVVPVIVLLGVYVPQFVQGNSELQARKAAAAEQLAIAQDALEPVCERIAADDPYESYHDYGYRIIGYLRDNDLGSQAAYVYLSFDADGTLTDVDYTSQIDPEANFEDNLARVEQDIATLCAPLNGLDISVAAPGLLMPCSLSDDFKQAFLAGSLYEGISIKTEDKSIKSYYTFDTDPEDEFDEYAHPEISLMLSAKKS